MPNYSFPAHAPTLLVPRQIRHMLRLTVLLAGLFICQSLCTPSTLYAPTHYTRSRPCVLDTSPKNACHVSNRVPVHTRSSPNWLPQPSKILPKSSCFASRGTFPWSASVDSDILGMLNAPLSFQPLELDSQTLNLDNLARIHDTFPVPNLLMTILTLLAPHLSQNRTLLLPSHRLCLATRL